jgi:hypothetical protein
MRAIHVHPVLINAAARPLGRTEIPRGHLKTVLLYSICASPHVHHHDPLSVETALERRLLSTLSAIMLDASQSYYPKSSWRALFDYAAGQHTDEPHYITFYWLDLEGVGRISGGARAELKLSLG